MSAARPRCWALVGRHALSQSLYSMVLSLNHTMRMSSNARDGYVSLTPMRCDAKLTFIVLVCGPRPDCDHVQASPFRRCRQAPDMATKGCWYEFRSEAFSPGSSRTHLSCFAVHTALWISLHSVVRHATTQDPDQTCVSTHVVSMDSPNSFSSDRSSDQQAVRCASAIVRYRSGAIHLAL
jgi:hypothetical protein